MSEIIAGTYELREKLGSEHPCTRYLWKEQGSFTYPDRVWSRPVHLLCQ